MNPKTAPKLVHKIFLIGIVLKGINGVLELIGGVVLLVISSHTIIHFVEIVTEGELIHESHDIFANFLLSSAHSLVLVKYFSSFFLLSHGIVKLFLIYGLLKRILWFYHLAIGIFVLFIVYQTYRYFLSPSFLMILLNIFDVIVILFTYLEYRNLKAKKI